MLRRGASPSVLGLSKVRRPCSRLRRSSRRCECRDRTDHWRLRMFRARRNIGRPRVSFDEVPGRDPVIADAAVDQRHSDTGAGPVRLPGPFRVDRVGGITQGWRLQRPVEADVYDIRLVRRTAGCRCHRAEATKPLISGN